MHLHSCFFLNGPATTVCYSLSLHDALPICGYRPHLAGDPLAVVARAGVLAGVARTVAEPLEDRFGQRVDPRARIQQEPSRSEEHTSELQSHVNLVCRLLLEKKNTTLD